MMEYVLICFRTLYVEVYLFKFYTEKRLKKSFRTLYVEVYWINQQGIEND